MRVWHYPERPQPPRTFASIKPRGLYLLQLEFLHRHPAPECVVTTYTPGVESLAALFPRTTFRVYRAPRQAPDAQREPNLHCHDVPFDKNAARLCGETGGGGGLSLLFGGEGMERQMALLLAAKPTAALLLITSPPDHYLAGQLMYPLYCERNSHLAALVVTGRRGETPRGQYYDARHYVESIQRFHQAVRHSDAYDRDMETLIVRAYAGAQCGDAAAELLGEVVRMGLPPADERDLYLWDEPSE